MKQIFLIIAGLMISFGVSSQILTPVTWSYAAKKTSPTEAILYLKADVDPGWHIYAQNIPKGEAISTSFRFSSSPNYKINGGTNQPKPITKFEKSLDLNVSYYEKSVVFTQKIKLNKKVPTVVKGEVDFMVCDAIRCLPSETITFSIPVK